MTSSPVGSGLVSALTTSASAPGAPRLGFPVQLGISEQAAIRVLAREVGSLDGAEPLNEPARLRLEAVAGPQLAHVLATANAVILGYAQVQRGDPVEAEILVGPGRDRIALAGDLIAAAESLTTAAVLIWSRGRSPVGPAAVTRGYAAVRTLLTMRRSLADVALAATDPPAGITLRAFVPGKDDDAWLAANAAVFATHPEQGSWTRRDLAERVGAPWFDADGFILAVDDDDRLLGYHWTKLHEPAGPGELPIAEVYVLGIAPSAQGRGLGRILLDAGLRHLAAGPARDVILYVEAANPTAVHLYERDGFAVDRRDVQLRRAQSD